MASNAGSMHRNGTAFVTLTFSTLPPRFNDVNMQIFRGAIVALFFCAGVPAYAGTRVAVDRGDYAGPLEIRVGVPQDDEEPKWIEGRRLASESSVDVASLAVGTYVVLISGDGPLLRSASRVSVRGQGDETIRIALPKARPLHGAIRIGSESAGDVAINLQHKEFGWSTNVFAHVDGTFDALVWQGGTFSLIARGGALASTVERPVQIDGPVLSVDLSPLRIIGVVTDADGAPVPEARVNLHAEFGRETANVRLLTDRHGMFEFSDVRQGPHTITVVADGYLIAADRGVYVTGKTPVERVGISIDAGVARSMRIVGAGGRPVPGAVIQVISDARLRSMTTTDADGRATVSIPPSGTAAAWVMPTTGSFAVVRLDPSPKSPMHEVAVAEGSATVTVDVLTSADAGVPGLALLMRYDGEMLLPSTLSLRTDENGRAVLKGVPPGLYEFWPFTTAEEAAELIESQAFSPVAAPITIRAGAGASRATVIVENNELQRGAAQ